MPSPHSGGRLWGGHTLCYRCKPSLSTGPSHPSQKDVPEQVGDSSQHTLVFLPSRKVLIPCPVSANLSRGGVCARMGSGQDQRGCLCQDGLRAGSRPVQSTSQIGNTQHLESSAAGICLQSSLCCVWCPAGLGSLHCLWLTSREVTLAMTIPLSSACDLRMQINDHSMSLDGYKWPLHIGRATFPPGAICGGG